MESIKVKEIKKRERRYREKDEPFGKWTIKMMSPWWNEVELRNVLRELELGGGEKILDAGCNDGRLLEYIHSKFPGCKLFGIDFASNPMKEMLKKRLPVCAVCGDITELPFKENSFDCFVSLQTIQQLPSYKERIQSLRNVFYSLRDEGKFIIGVDSQKTWANMVANGKEGPLISVPDLYVYLYDPDELRRDLEVSGFTDIQIMAINNIPRKYLRSLKALGVYLDIFITRFIKSLSFSRGSYLLAKCRKGKRGT